MPLPAARFSWRSAALAFFTILFGAGGALAAPALVVDADSGQVLYEKDATQPWFPASVTKLMTTYVALSAVRDGRLTMDTPLTMSLRAARQQPSKMGFRPGTEVTLDNALKMLMVKSPNDVAVMVAEGISGSVENFADEMNAAAQHLGLHESHFVNPNGLHDPNHVSSARDMAMIGRALLREFPEHADLFDIGALQLGNEIINNHNGLLGHYPGADGMKTGFTCSAGFNVVASATHNGRRLIVVVLGSPSARERTMEAAQLFDRGFAQWGGGSPLESLPASYSTQAPDMRADICSRRNRAAVAAAEEESFAASMAAPASMRGRGATFAVASADAVPSGLSNEPVHFDPIPVFVGRKPGWIGPALAARATDNVSKPAPDAAAPDASAPSATAYTGEKALGADSSANLEAPIALQGALRTPPPKPVAQKSAKPSKTVAAAKPKTPALQHKPLKKIDQ